MWENALKVTVEMKDGSKRVILLEMFSRMNMPTLRENSLSSQHPDFMNDEHFWL